MGRILALLAVGLMLALGSPAAAEPSSVDSPEHLAFIEGLPAARAAIQAEQQHRLDHGVTAEMHEAYAAIVDFLGDAWLRLASVWPEDHFGAASHAEYLDTFTLSRIAFYRAVNTFPDTAPDTADEAAVDGALLGIIIANRLVKDLDNFVADTATAQLSRHDPVLPLQWLQEWLEAAH